MPPRHPQPAVGETVLHCGHLEADLERAKLFRFSEPVRLKNDAGEIRAEGSWAVICAACLKRADVLHRGDRLKVLCAFDTFRPQTPN